MEVITHIQALLTVAIHYRPNRKNKKYQKLTNACSLVVTSQEQTKSLTNVNQVNQLYIKRLSKVLVITSLMFNNYLTGCADRRHRLNKMIFSLN